MKRWLGVALLGSLICTVCDHLHVVLDVLSYARPICWGQAWWVPLLFAFATLAVVAGAAPMRALFASGFDRPPSLGELGGDAIGFVIAYAYTAFGHRQPLVVAAVLGGFWLARVLHARPAWMMPYGLAVAAGGTLFEAALSSTGAFRYHHPDFLGVPVWLAGIYLHCALFAGSLHVLLVGQSQRAR
ncbi:MAG: hypothetical protein EXR72_05940 [Myxococcales bacterium]|nr:hypothetical protein [Myxococcales bacterium]